MIDKPTTVQGQAPNDGHVLAGSTDPVQAQPTAGKSQIEINYQRLQ